ncbi:uncharacterized protein LOC127691980 [Apodemus sylvaticus]|uniref:uncharacterized protein LOC127691980 n=1 Tax=Apodemus sylvaticus TaxID=10129 RepID=UPI002244B07C|nr:uncharacterized protein LOC127691980 [Apodemus sylvaticus]
MEIFFLLMNSIIDLWKIPSSMSLVVDMGFAIMCGVGLFYLLIPFLKEYPESPPPGSQKNIPKVVKRAQRKGKKKTAPVKACRNSPKNTQDTQNASRPIERPIHHPLLDSFPHPFWYSKEELNQLSLPQLFSHFKVLQALIHQKFNQLLCGISSVLSEAVVATAWVSKKPSSGRRKCVRFDDTSDPNQPLSVPKEPPQLCQDQYFPHQHVTRSMVGLIGAQEPENIPSSIPKQTSPPKENVPWQHKQNWNDITGYDIQKCKAAISQPTDNLSGECLPTKAIRSASICPGHYQMIHHHEDPEHKKKAINVGEHKGTHVRFCPSGELIKLQENYQPNGGGYFKNQPELNQPAQPSILSSKHKCSQMMGSVPTVIPLKSARASSTIFNRVGDKNLPCTSSSTHGKGLEPRNPALKTDKLLSINTSNDLSFIDPNTKMKLEASITQLPVKHRRRFPCVSKSEFYSKTAMILEKLHHQDPGGKRVETVSSARLQCPLFEYSCPEVWETQRTPLPAASHGPTRSNPDQWLSSKSVQPNTSCLQAKHQQRGTIQATVRGTLQSNTSPGMAKHEPWKQSQDAASAHPQLSATTLSPEDRFSPSMSKKSNILKVKEELPHAWRVSVASTEIPKGQAINTFLKGFESVDHLQTPSTQNSGDFKIAGDRVAHSKSSLNNITRNPVRFENISPKFQGQGDSLRNESPLSDMDLQEEVDRENLIYNTAVELQYCINTLLQNLEDNENEPSKLTIDPVTQVQEFKRESTFHLDNSTLKLELGSPHQSPKGHNNSFRYKEIRGKQDPEIGYKAFEPHQNTKKKNGPSSPSESQRQPSSHGQGKWRPGAIAQQACDHQLNILKRITFDNLLTPKGKNHACRHRVTGDKQQLELADQKACDSGQSTRSRMGSCPHGNSKWHNLPFRYREIGEKAPLGVNAQRTCDQHPHSMKGRSFDHLPSPERNRHPHSSKVVGDEQQSSLAPQRAYDAGQIKKKSGMASCPYRCPDGYNFAFRRGLTGNQQHSGIVLRICEQHQSTKEGKGQSMSPKANHSVKHRGHRGQDQSGLSA